MTPHERTYWWLRFHEIKVKLMCSNARNFTVCEGHIKLISNKTSQNSDNTEKFQIASKTWYFSALSRNVAMGSHFGWQPLTTKKQHINSQNVSVPYTQ